MAITEPKALIDEAEVLLAAIRGSILVHVQDGVEPFHLKAPLDSARALYKQVWELGDDEVAAAADALEAWLTMLAAETDPISHTRTRSLLDQISELEIALIAHKTRAVGGSLNVGEFVDETFETLRLDKGAPESPPPSDSEKNNDLFELDSDMLDVFGEEAEDLLENMRESLETLATRPKDRDALWEIKRSAHTFKGAAGVVGLRNASELAHRVEDLLERISEKNADPDDVILSLLHASTGCLASLSNGKSSGGLELESLQRQFDKAIEAVTSPAKSPSPQLIPKPVPSFHPSNGSSAPIVPKPSRTSPIVRVSLDRLDDLFRNVRDLGISRAAFEHRVKELEQQLEESHNNALRLQGASNNIESLKESPAAQSLAETHFDQSSYELAETARDAGVINSALEGVCEEFQDLFSTQSELIGSMQDRLMRLRNVEFGTITNRLQRTVRVTCDEEGKHADVSIDNSSLEIDTQLIDSLIEPLLHLLKNAVVHGIESPETRRMLGKPEVGRITIRVSNKNSYIVLSVTDDGRGITFRPLLDKAVASGLISRAEAERLTPEEVRELIFLPGLTTAEKLNLNAGRGVGMSIVRESIAALGGSVSIETWPQRGTTFSIRVPRPFAETSPSAYAGAQPLSSLTPGTYKILIVDDSPSVRLMTSKTIEKAGWYFETAKNGIDALEKLRSMSVHPDVILTDIEMPKMGGYELLAALRDDEWLSSIPVVFISSRNGSMERDRALASGVAEYLKKPYDQHRLIELVERLAASKESVR